jgi:hypothetical protein
VWGLWGLPLPALFHPALLSLGLGLCTGRLQTGPRAQVFCRPREDWGLPEATQQGEEGDSGEEPVTQLLWDIHPGVVAENTPVAARAWML